MREKLHEIPYATFSFLSVYKELIKLHMIVIASWYTTHEPSSIDQQRLGFYYPANMRRYHWAHDVVATLNQRHGR